MRPFADIVSATVPSDGPLPTDAILVGTLLTVTVSRLPGIVNGQGAAMVVGAAAIGAVVIGIGLGWVEHVTGVDERSAGGSLPIRVGVVLVLIVIALGIGVVNPLGNPTTTAVVTGVFLGGGTYFAARFVLAWTAIDPPAGATSA